MSSSINFDLFGKRLYQCREATRITQEAFADDCSISSRYFSDLERGKKCPSLETLVRIANRAEVSLDYLLRDSLTVFENRTPPIEDTLITFPPEQQEILRDFIKRLAATMQ